MNEWDKTKFDEMIFEYLEGTLSREDNLLVIEYLNKHPHHYAEFEQWSKTYALRELPLEDYEIASGLIKHSSNNKRIYWMYSSVLLLLLGILSVAVFSPYKIEQERMNPTNQVAPAKVKVLNKKSIDQNTPHAPTQRKIANNKSTNRNNESATPATSDSLYPKEADATPEIFIPAEASNKKEYAKDSIVSESGTIHPATLKANETEQKNNSSKKRKKLKVDLNPSKEILKTNDNF